MLCFFGGAVGVEMLANRGDLKEFHFITPYIV